MKKSILSIFLLSVALTGCIKDDLRDCPTGLYITFDTCNPAHDYPELVATLDLYFYDLSGDLKASIGYARDELRTSDRAAFIPSMPAGEYRVVAVVKSGTGDYEILDTTIYENSQAILTKDVCDNKMTDLFSAGKLITVKGRVLGGQTENMTLIKHNNDIRLNVEYDGYAAPQGMTLHAAIEDNAGQFNFCANSNTVVRNARFLPWASSYHTSGDNEGLPKFFDISTFRLFAGSGASITIYETPASRAYVPGGSYPGRFYTLNIVDEIGRELTPAQLSALLEFDDRFTIKITIGKDFVVLKVVVDHWNNTPGGEVDV